MENDLAKFNIEKAAKEMLKRPLGSDFLIFSKEPEKIIQLSKIVAVDLSKKTESGEQWPHFIFDCKTKTLANQQGRTVEIKTSDDEFTLKKVAEQIGGKTVCVLLILHFDNMHADMRINKWNQGFLRVMKGNEAGKSSIHKDSIIIAGYSGEGSIASDLYLPAFELI